MEARKISGVVFIVVGGVMYQAALPLSAYLQGIGAHPYLVVFAYSMSALAVVPIVLGLYRLFTQGKQRAA